VGNLGTVGKADCSHY